MFLLLHFSFGPASFESKTVEAERISVDHVAHLKPSDGGSAATQCNLALPSLSFSSLLKFFSIFVYYDILILITIEKPVLFFIINFLLFSG